MAEGTIGLAEPSTLTKSLRSVTQTINGSVVHQEVMTLGGANSSLEIAAVRAAAPASTDYGVVVRIAGGPSSAVDLQARVNQGVGNSSAADFWNINMRSSAANALVTVYQSTATDLSAQVQPIAGSTWRTQPGSTLWASSAGFHFDSSGALQVTGATASTVVTVARTVGNSSAADYMPVRIVDSSGTGFLAPGLEFTDGSTTSTLAAPGLSYINGSNTTMRMVGITQPLPVQIVKSTPTRASVSQSVTISASTTFTELISSLAGNARCVFAYSITSTAVTPIAVTFMSGTATTLWSVDVGSGSSGVSGANLAVAPPGSLFQTASAANLNVTLGSTGVAVKVNVAYFSE